MLADLLANLEAAALPTWLRRSFPAYPLLNAVHILGAGGLVVLVWLMHRARRVGPLAGFGSLRHLRNLVVIAICVMVVTGATLFSVNPDDYVANPAFRVKLLLIVAALVNVALYYALRAYRPVGTAVSVLIWPAILAAGRIIGFL